MRGLRMTARAMEVRCFWPPERVTPRSPTMVSKPLGNSRISVAMWAMVAASSTLLGGGVGDTEGDVLADGVGEEEGLLRDEADVLAQGVEGEAADGLAVDEDGAGGGVVQAGDEVDEGGFAGAGGAYDGEAGAGGDAEVDVVEDGWGRRGRRRLGCGTRCRR